MRYEVAVVNDDDDKRWEFATLDEAYAFFLDQEEGADEGDEVTLNDLESGRTICTGENG